LRSFAFPDGAGKLRAVPASSPDSTTSRGSGWRDQDTETLEAGNTIITILKYILLLGDKSGDKKLELTNEILILNQLNLKLKSCVSNLEQGFQRRRK